VAEGVTVVLELPRRRDAARVVVLRDRADALRALAVRRLRVLAVAPVLRARCELLLRELLLAGLDARRRDVAVVRVRELLRVRLRPAAPRVPARREVVRDRVVLAELRRFGAPARQRVAAPLRLRVLAPPALALLARRREPALAARFPRPALRVAPRRVPRCPCATFFRATFFRPTSLLKLLRSPRAVWS
jgi:hypothetical protein